MRIIEIAQVAYEVNAAYCRVLNDNSFLPWKKAPSWQKEAVTDGIFFAKENPNVTPKSMHENWRNVKIADGWVHGKVKDAKLKTDPCILPFDELPLKHKAKVHIFLQLILSLIQIDEDG